MEVICKFLKWLYICSTNLEFVNRLFMASEMFVLIIDFFFSFLKRFPIFAQEIADFNSLRSFWKRLRVSEEKLKVISYRVS